VAGYVLFTYTDDITREKPKFSINNPTFYLVLGIISGVTGILKLLSPLESRAIIFGDLIPAAGGIIAGIILIFGIYRQDISKTGLEKLAANLLVLRKSIGIGLIIIAIVHFMFGELFFL